MDAIDSATLLKLAIDRAGAINTYWNIYLGVSTAVLGIMASGKAFVHSRTLKVLLSLLFAVFAYSNLDAIWRLADLRLGLLALLEQAQVAPVLLENLRPAARWQYGLFHGLLDLGVLAAIWFVPWPGRTQSP